MKKRELLKIIDDEFLEKLYGFCYARTRDSYEAQDLCSDIILEIVKASRAEGEIAETYAFIWRVARNVYADFCEKEKRRGHLPEKEPEEVFDESEELLQEVFRRIAFLTKSYRDAMIMYYIEGHSVKEISKVQACSENNVRQRLFTARIKIKNEVEIMDKIEKRPIALEKMRFVLWGTGNPSWGDPRPQHERQLSNHIVWLCRKKAMSASEIADKLNVPTLYVEEELEILEKSGNDSYGLLRKTEGGKYVINVVLLDKSEMDKANAIYTKRLPMVARTVLNHIEKYKDDYLAFPYINKRVDLNLVLWQNIKNMAERFSYEVNGILKEKYFASFKAPERGFTVFGYEDNGKYYGGGCDGLDAEYICGYRSVYFENIYITRIKQHFSCGMNISHEPQMQLAIRAIEGLEISSLSQDEKEQAAKAIESGYLYRDGDTLYTKILVCDMKDLKRLFNLNDALQEAFKDEAAKVAEEMAEFIFKALPKHLYPEWSYANALAQMPILDALCEILIEKGVLVPPEGGLGAEGCWLAVKK